MLELYLKKSKRRYYQLYFSPPHDLTSTNLLPDNCPISDLVLAGTPTGGRGGGEWEGGGVVISDSRTINPRDTVRTPCRVRNFDVIDNTGGMSWGFLDF